MADLNFSFLKVVSNLDKKLHFKIYYTVLSLPQVLFQIHILLALLLLVYSINPLIVHLSSSIYSMHTFIHVFTFPFSILSFSDDIKLKFVALMTYMKH